ncbi:MAG: PAS domain S-box protein, partial [Phycisphaerales bacterium]|nr:PAS domain S-box protein [Phycisphaerales bacterium]
PAQALEFVHAGDRSRVRADVQLAIESGRDFEVECRIVRADGEERWMLSRGQMMRDAVNKPTRLLGVMLDITQRRATYEELRLRDERIRSLLDATAEGIYGLDMEGRCTFANESCARLLGYDSADQLLGHNMHTLIHHHRPDGNVYPMEECRIFATFQKNEGVHVDDEVFFRRDGTAFPVEYWSHPVTRDGELVGSVVTFLDISERLDAQHRIVESEVFLRSSINSLGTHLAILDSDARIIRTNRAWDEFGARNGANADRIGEQANYLEVCAAAGDDEVATSVRRALEELLAGDRQEFAIEYPCHSPEEQRWFLLRLTRFETPSGTYAVSAHDDITARKLTEHRLERRTEILSRLNEVNRSLAAELDLEQLVDRVTQVTTRLCGAEFGAFFYNVERRGDPSYMLYAIAGADRAEFEQFPMPRATDIFGPTFRGEGVIRLDDVTADPRYGRNAPFAGMPAKHLPVRSYLAVPVITRSGEVLGGLFFGHSDAGVFSETSESLVVGVAGQAAVAIDNARLYRDVERREEEYRGTFENAAVGIVHVDLDGSVLRVNDRLGEITGRDPGTLPGTPLVDLIEADDGELVATLLREVAGGSVHKSNDELRYRHAGGEAVWAMQTASLVRDDEGGSSYVVLIVQDISDRKQAEEHQNLLVRELSHRVKNLLATVASISSQTLRQATDLDEFADSFQGRLSALANVHTLLVQTEWKGASLQLIVDRNFAPYAEDHEDSLRTRGVDVFLNPRAALAISLVLHELTTNAIKYGALSDRAGAIDLAWELTDQANEQSLVIQWRERGGPPVTPPSTTGFGSTLIQKGIEFELDGDVRFEYRPEGIACRLQVPAASFMGE